ncbi:MNIO family bufferin maturase [Vibrio sp. WXL103]|uniref:MNIO family bufferin maturase n=1 Tax=Vibrio sp. WXL103 TaxID=3450710 RepID=UPI003EC54965
MPSPSPAHIQPNLDSMQAVGVGLRLPHIDYFAQELPSMGWLEIHSENYFEPNSVARQQLRQIARHYPISCHGIGLSLGSVERISQAHLTQLKQLITEVDPILISDHLSWSQHGGHYFNDLLPLPYTEEALAVFCRNVLEVQDTLARPMLIENPSSYLAFNHSTISEWEFLAEVQRRTDCRLLLDLNNIHVSAFNHRFDSRHYIDQIPAHAVDEIHLAGFTVKHLEQGEIWIDTHSRPVSDEVWQLYRYWLEQHGPRHTLIEWDLDIPEPAVLLAEADKARTLLGQVCPYPTTQAMGG